MTDTPKVAPAETEVPAVAPDAKPEVAPVVEPTPAVTEPAVVSQ